MTRRVTVIIEEDDRSSVYQFPNFEGCAQVDTTPQYVATGLPDDPFLLKGTTPKQVFTHSEVSIMVTGVALPDDRKRIRSIGTVSEKLKAALDEI